MFEHALDFVRNGNGAKDDHVRMRLRGPHIALGHWGDGGTKLFDHRLRGTSALANVAILTTLKTNVVCHVNEHSPAEKAAQLRPVQGEQTFDDYKWSRLE
jgi:hypothetical protein